MSQTVIATVCFDPGWPVFHEILPAGSKVVPTPGGYINVPDDSIMATMGTLPSEGENAVFLAMGHSPCKAISNEQAAIGLIESYAKTIRMSGMRAESLFLGSRAIWSSRATSDPIMSEVYIRACDEVKPKYTPRIVPRVKKISLAPFFYSDQMGGADQICLSTLFPLWEKGVEIIKDLSGGKIPERDYSVSVPTKVRDEFEAVFVSA